MNLKIKHWYLTLAMPNDSWVLKDEHTNNILQRSVIALKAVTDHFRLLPTTSKFGEKRVNDNNFLLQISWKVNKPLSMSSVQGRKDSLQFQCEPWRISWFLLKAFFSKRICVRNFVEKTFKRTEQTMKELFISRSYISGFSRHMAMKNIQTCRAKCISSFCFPQ